MDDTEALPPKMQLNIDFNKLKAVAEVGVRRASVFMGVGTNAIAVDPPISHILSDNVQFHFVPPDPSDEMKRHYLEEFESWTIGNCLRDLADSFSMFLTEAFFIHLLLQTMTYSESEDLKAKRKFEKLNVGAQYSWLALDLQLRPDLGEMFETFRLARNCLSHRMGNVTLEDAPSGELRIRWCLFGASVVGEDGQSVLMDNATIGTDQSFVARGGPIMLGMHWKERAFPVGTAIRLSRHDLSEMCMGVTLVAEHVVQKLIEYTRAKGVPVNVLDPIDRAEEPFAEGSEPA
ncbi:hypothetical protein EN904_16300 [Mesorhizobium sp. M7A.F.Ca.CA.001.07.2.1]|uniref:hypothetical protein n=1 Tax=Mesorhizobium TaxID=68287 RepID=UPI000FC9F652|nr:MULTISPECIES: hypothetical protein [Mesorhizobium]RVB37022.1 hypothetical protein EN918_15380 [Mesorhizobium sp. M7A.F.Ca.CA.004.05.1.1]MCF6127338.1 hypothetical protein [Mesorhizobium ciceri]MCQ8817461.1 hypothetical protein [Mesorhizobium sp. SEMIA396]RUX76852.1 hypothetical protein EN983_16785 [Mesorhizobium sp. M7A.F.Ca.CA.004.08.2.1]RUX84057.1 hypothetical protein EN982_24720 [Mesorhizobium sp. M7A.F.Ca.CA.004.08.1.1]